MNESNVRRRRGWLRLVLAVLVTVPFVAAAASPPDLFADEPPRFAPGEGTPVSPRVGRRNPEDEEMPPAMWVVLVVLQGVTAATFLALGAVVGSYLNVVAYRLPRGMSVFSPPSSCPECGSRIEPRDNIPILGWWMLGGRCRQCRSPISIRYPIVEGVLGAAFLWFLFLQILSGGAVFPTRSVYHYTGVVWTIFYTKWDLISLYAYHMLLVSGTASLCLIEIDGERPPRILWIGLLVLGMACVAAVPYLHPLPLSAGLMDRWLAGTWSDPMPVPTYGNGVRNDWTGRFAASALVGLAVSTALLSANGLRGFLRNDFLRNGFVRNGFAGNDVACNGFAGNDVACRHRFVFGIVVGTFLGWQTGVSFVAVTSALEWMLRVSRGPTVAIPVSRSVVLVVHLSTWRWLDEQSWWIGTQGTVGASVAWIVGALTLSSLAAFVPISVKGTPRADLTPD